MGADPVATERYFVDKGIEAELRKMKRQNRRAANKAYRDLPEDEKYYVAEPSNIQNLLTGLETDRFDREAMSRKGFRNEAGRMLAKGLGTAALMTLLGKYQNTPRQITRPQGAFGQPNTIDLNALQRLGMVLGLGPY